MTLQMSIRRFEKGVFTLLKERLETWEEKEFFSVYPESIKTKISFSDVFPKTVKDLNGKSIITVEVVSERNQSIIHEPDSLSLVLSLNIFSQTRSKNLEVQEFLIDLIGQTDLTKIKMIDNSYVGFVTLERRVKPDFDSSTDIFNSFIDYRFFIRRLNKLDTINFLEVRSNFLNVTIPENFDTQQNNSNFLQLSIGELESHARSLKTVDFSVLVNNFGDLIPETNHRTNIPLYMHIQTENLDHRIVDIADLDSLLFTMNILNFDYF